MLTLMAYFTRSFPDIEFYYIIFIGLFFDFILVLFLSYFIEKRKSGLQNRYKAIIDRYKNEQKQFEDTIRILQGKTAKGRQQQSMMNEQQDNNQKKLAEQSRIIAGYKIKIESYEAELVKLRAQNVPVENKGSANNTIKNLQPVPSTVIR